MSVRSAIFWAGVAAAVSFGAALRPAEAQSRQHRAIDIAEDCGPCHGVDGIAKDRDVPHLAGQNEGYLYNQLMAFRSGKRPHKEMRYLARPMTDAEIKQLAEYFASLPAR